MEEFFIEKTSRPISRAVKDATNQKSLTDMKSLSSIGQESGKKTAQQQTTHKLGILTQMQSISLNDATPINNDEKQLSKILIREKIKRNKAKLLRRAK
jgi:hypothetical protein